VYSLGSKIISSVLAVSLGVLFVTPVFAGSTGAAVQAQAKAKTRTKTKTRTASAGPSLSSRVGESSEKLKTMLIENGYRAVADDGSEVAFDQTEIDSLKETSRQDARFGSKTYLVVYFEAQSSEAWGADSIIAIFDRAPTLHIVDAANVQGDRETYIMPKLRVSPSDDLLVAMCAHLNAGEDYCFIALYSLVKGKITRVDQTLPMLYSPRCGGLDLRRDYKMSVIKDPSGKKGKILFRVKEEEIRYDEEDSEKTKSRHVHFYPFVLAPRGSFYVLGKNDPLVVKMRAHAKKLGVDDPF
jgi:hypothetical protein